MEPFTPGDGLDCDPCVENDGENVEMYWDEDREVWICPQCEHVEHDPDDPRV